MTRICVARAAAGLLLICGLAGPDRAQGQSEADHAEAVSLGLDGFLETERFAVFWHTEEATSEQVRELLPTVDTFYERIGALVRPDRTPHRRIVVMLGGFGQASDGTWRFPNVNRAGRVILYRYSTDFADHAVEAAHELAHAFRRAAGYWYSGFWEEGFAEAIAMEVDPDDVGFPRYGYPLTVAAGHLLAWEEYIPLEDIRARHREMGRRCQIQAYLERAAFFAYLVELQGIQTLIDLAYGPRNPNNEDMEATYGKAFEELVADWEAALLTDYLATADADEMARRYRAEPAIESRPFCGGG